MARAIKKVKNVKKRSKKFIAILTSSIVAGVILIGVLIGVIIFLNNKEEKDSTYYYFEDINAIKINYDNLEGEFTSTGAEYVFIFVYDNSTFDAKTCEDDDDYKITDEKIVSAVKELKSAVEAKNEELGGVAYLFYLIDTQKVGNSSILNNTSYGNFNTAPCLIYLENQAYKQKVDEIIVSGVDAVTGENSTLVGYLNAAANFVQTND